jgi:protein-tyrosine-phosphatase
MAEALMRQMVELQNETNEWTVESAGTWAGRGLPAVKDVQTVIEARGLSLANHRSRPVDRLLLKQFNLILVMEKNHQEALQVEFPDLSSRVYLLSEMNDLVLDIDDPMGGELIDFQVAAHEIEIFLKDGYERIKSLAKRR